MESIICGRSLLPLFHPPKILKGSAGALSEVRSADCYLADDVNEFPSACRYVKDQRNATFDYLRGMRKTQITRSMQIHDGS